jgi:hypothetical protein
MQLVAHVERALHDRLERNSARGQDGFSHDRCDHVLDVQQTLPHAVVIDTVVQAARVGPFIEIAVGEISPFAVLDHQDRHGCGVDAGERTDAIEFAAGREANFSPRNLGVGIRRGGGQTFEQRTTDHRTSLAAVVVLPRHERTGGQDRVAIHTRECHLGGQNVDEQRLGGAKPAVGFGIGLLALRAHSAHILPVTDPSV